MPKSIQEQYTTEILPELKKELSRENVHDVPRFQKVVVNVGMGSYLQRHGKDYANVERHLTLITGQKPALRLSRKAVSNFKLRQNEPVGLVVTLRGKRMFDFIGKLVHVVLPRVRDFRGISAEGFDEKGNYSLGMKEHTVFPEVPTSEDNVPAFGIEITVVTSATSKEDGRALLKKFGFPFRDKNSPKV